MKKKIIVMLVSLLVVGGVSAYYFLSYAPHQEAEKRNTYLSAFDGGILDPGSHYVYGTVVIRTSRHLTASQQTALTEKIYNKLIELKK